MVKSFLQGRFHLFGRRLRNNSRGHVVEMVFELVHFVPMPGLKCMHDYQSQVAISRHASRARLGFELGGIVIRQVNSQVHGFLFSD
jgi:hypothetical protein